MNPSDHTDPSIGDQPRNPLLERLRDEFDAAWKASLTTGHKPLLAIYLERVAQGERAALRGMLEAIQHIYEQRVSVVRSGAAQDRTEFADVNDAVIPGRVGQDDASDFSFRSDSQIDLGDTVQPALATDPEVTLDVVPSDSLERDPRSSCSGYYEGG